MNRNEDRLRSSANVFNGKKNVMERIMELVFINIIVNNA